MSKYTTQIRWIIDESLTAHGIDISKMSIPAKINASIPYIFDFAYPIFDTDQKATLENKILLNYYTREIGFETVALWKLKLQSKLNLIMPYYIQLYEQASSDIDLYGNVDITTNISGTYGKGTYQQDSGGINNTYTNTLTNDLNDKTDSTHTSERASTVTERFNDTPQGAVRLTVPDGNYEKTWLTAYKTTDTKDNLISDTSNVTTKKTGTQKNTGNNNSTNTTRHDYGGEDTRKEEIKKKGREGGLSNIEILMRVRESFINIDKMIIDELDSLFMQLW